MVVIRTYKLTLKDKIYLFFNEDRLKRIAYLFPKVEEHQFNWFNENRIRIPIDFNRYIYACVDNLIFEYDLGK